MRTNIKDLPRAIGKEDISFSLNSEFEYFQNQTLDNIQKNFKYPNVDNFSELTLEEKRELKEILEESARTTLEFFRKIHRFNSHFRTVYNKYKHVMSEVTGIYGIDKVRNNIESQVYVRHKSLDEKKNSQYSVYVIPLSTEAIQYFDKIARCVWTLLELLIDNQLLFFANEGKDFIPRFLLIPEGEKRQRYVSLTKKITSYCLPNFQAIMIVNPAIDIALRTKIAEAFKTDFVYVMKKDILDLEFLKDSQLTSVSQTETTEDMGKTHNHCQDFEIVDIVSEKEDWSKYRLTDGTVLKVRAVLIKAIRLSSFDQQGKPIYDLNTQTITGTVPDKSILGKQSASFTQEELSSSIVNSNIGFEVIQEPWNSYKLSDGTEIEVKTVLSAVSKSSKHAAYGEPIFMVNSSISIKTNIPIKLRKS